MMSKLNTKGLTLIECVISILILAVTITGGLMLYSNANVIMSTAMHKKIALEMAVQEMEEIKDTEYTKLSSGPWENKTFGLFTAQIRKTITDVSAPPNAMKKVQLEVSWTEDKSDPKIIKLETLMSP